LLLVNTIIHRKSKEPTKTGTNGISETKTLMTIMAKMITIILMSLMMSMMTTMMMMMMMTTVISYLQVVWLLV